MQAGLTQETNNGSLSDINYGSEFGLIVKTGLEDEGFCSNKCSPHVNSKLNYVSEKKEIIDNAWNEALKFSISEYVDWEMRDE